MKILHTSDWHLGKRLERFSRLEEQKNVMQELCQMADDKEADVVLVCGDLFDTYNPPTEAVDLFYKTLKQLSGNGERAVIAIAGNHDSPDRIEAPDPLARECGIVLAGYPNSVIPPFSLDSGVTISESIPGYLRLKLPQHSYQFGLLFTPYANEIRLKSFLGHENSEQRFRELLTAFWQKTATNLHREDVNVLAAHLLIVKTDQEIPEEPEEEKPILHLGGAQAILSQQLPSEVQYAALGHLHRHQKIDSVSCPAVYSGSPLAFSFSEAEQQKYAVLIEVEPNSQATIEKLPLQSGKFLHKKRFTRVEDTLQWLTQNQDCYVELTMATPEFLSATERKQLSEAHEGIVSIIPEPQSEKMDSGEHTQIDLNKSITELFIDYFLARHGQKPNKRLMDLFKQVLSEEPE
ncbi:exonuclease subunit SbcD [candidate division KSB1 bacterium]|nr:exonuclease subunit SbcD [candidate division KSB1 bacterium]